MLAWLTSDASLPRSVPKLSAPCSVARSDDAVFSAWVLAWLMVLRSTATPYRIFGSGYPIPHQGWHPLAFDHVKRWAGLPRGSRWLIAGIAAAVLALAAAWVLFVPAADWIAHHDVGSAKGALLQTARDAARGRLLTLGAGLFAAGALIFTAQNVILSRRMFELTVNSRDT